jgi:hypothetical protein
MPLGVSTAKNQRLQASGKLSLTMLERSLVTWPRVTDAESLLSLDVATLVRAPSQRRAFVFAPSSSLRRRNDDAPTILGEVDATRIRSLMSVELGCASLTTVTLTANEELLFIASKSRECAIAGRTHASSEIHFMVNLRSMRYAQRCHSKKGCSDARYTWIDIDDESAGELVAILGLDRAPRPSPSPLARTSSAPPRLGSAGPRSASPITTLVASSDDSLSHSTDEACRDALASLFIL